MRMVTKDLITRDECLSLKDVKIFISKHELQFYVYFLIDPFSFQIKYVGKGQGYRCVEHLEPNSLNSSSLKNTWLNKLLKRNKNPLFVIWEFYENSFTAYDEENRMISNLGRKGIDKAGSLLNGRNSFKDGHLVAKEVTRSEAILKLLSVHPNYDYTELVWKGSKHEIQNIVCPLCSEPFSMDYYAHLRGQKCPKCSYRALGESKKTPNDVYIEKVKLIYKDTYQYDKIDYQGAKSYIKIHCNLCDSPLEKRATNFLQGRGCTSCTNKYNGIPILDNGVLRVYKREELF